MLDIINIKDKEKRVLKITIEMEDGFSFGNEFAFKDFINVLTKNLFFKELKYNLSLNEQYVKISKENPDDYKIGEQGGKLLEIRNEEFKKLEDKYKIKII